MKMVAAAKLAALRSRQGRAPYALKMAEVIAEASSSGSTTTPTRCLSNEQRRERS